MHFIKTLTKDTVFFISFLLAIISTVVIRPMEFNIDYKVIVILFDLMIIIAMLDTLGVLEFIALRTIGFFSNYRDISIAMVILCFVSSMFITNDIALITLVPITLSIAKALDIDPVNLIISETIAANIGSSLSPIGNPQNIFLYFHYGLNITEFALIMLPICVVGLIMILVVVFRSETKGTSHLTRLDSKLSDKRIPFVLALFAITLVIINSSINVYIYSFLLVVLVYLVDKTTIGKVDYYLLSTFLCLFIFINNVRQSGISELLTTLMNGPKSAFIVSAVLSQFISNVPASLLLASFTDNYRALILGVNIGGLGTIIASLASLISYRFYIGHNPQNKSNYLKQFHVVNFKFLVLLCIFALILI